MARITRKTIVAVLAASMLLAALVVLWRGRRRPLVSSEAGWMTTKVTCYDGNRLNSGTSVESTVERAKARGENNLVAVYADQLGGQFKRGDEVEVEVNGKSFRAWVRNTCAKGNSDCEKNKLDGKLIDVHYDTARRVGLLSSEIIRSNELKSNERDCPVNSVGRVRKTGKRSSWRCDTPTGTGDASPACLAEDKKWRKRNSGGGGSTRGEKKKPKKKTTPQKRRRR